MILDGHVTVGGSRAASLEVPALLARMEELGVDAALVSPPERFLPIDNREGNELVTKAASRSGGRLHAYAVATPWLGARAVEELRRAHAAGAVALKLDPTLQGFDLLDGQAEPLVGFAGEAGWPVYVRTGTPVFGLPLQLASLASRFPGVSFLMGRSGATDFSHDGPTALRWASNLYADSAHVEWPTALAASEPDRAGARVFFSTDAPFGDAATELARVRGTPLTDTVRRAILGETLAGLLSP